MRLPAEQSTDLRAELAPAVDLLRGRFSAMPHNTVPLILPADLTKPTGGAALMLRFLDQPATSPPPPFSSRKHLAQFLIG